jgi:hypothetical protein
MDGLSIQLDVDMQREINNGDKKYALKWNGGK